MIPNSTVDYIDADTGRLVARDEFVDPELHWCRPRCRCGCKMTALHLHRRFNCGEPLPQWLAANPKPAGAP